MLELVNRICSRSSPQLGGPPQHCYWRCPWHFLLAQRHATGHNSPGHQSVQHITRRKHGGPGARPNNCFYCPFPSVKARKDAAYHSVISGVSLRNALLSTRFWAAEVFSEKQNRELSDTKFDRNKALSVSPSLRRLVESLGPPRRLIHFNPSGPMQ
jgi:hypothetical protein